MNILIATEKPFAPAAVEGIRAIVESSGHTLRLLEKYPDKATLLSAVADVDALIIRSDLVDAEVLDAAPRLRIVVRAGAGVDNVDLDAATERDIVVMNTPGQNAMPWPNSSSDYSCGMCATTTTALPAPSCEESASVSWPTATWRAV